MYKKSFCQITPVFQSSGTIFLSMHIYIILLFTSFFLPSCNALDSKKEPAIYEGGKIPSENQLFFANLTCILDKTPLNQIHQWELVLKDIDDQPIEHAQIFISGGMPQHGHGYPTKPSIRKGKEPGIYIVEGIKFNMAGRWMMQFDVSANGKQDRFTFYLKIDP